MSPRLILLGAKINTLHINALIAITGTPTAKAIPTLRPFEFHVPGLKPVLVGDSAVVVVEDETSMSAEAITNIGLAKWTSYTGAWVGRDEEAGTDPVGSRPAVEIQKGSVAKAESVKRLLPEKILVSYLLPGRVSRSPEQPRAPP
ncbi:hypothetical protein ABW19_dt0210510 [Dactylella cylindrospora]|nr:hypothetical protein ABW19_dt0210510 [Dactylella cylindrospora]